MGKGHHKEVDDRNKNNSKSSSSLDHVLVVAPVSRGCVVLCVYDTHPTRSVSQSSGKVDDLEENITECTKLDLSVAARCVRVKSVVTDVMYFCAECGSIRHACVPSRVRMGIESARRAQQRYEVSVGLR